MIYTYYLVFTVYVNMEPIYKNWAVMNYGIKLKESHDIRVITKWLNTQFERDINDQIRNLGIDVRVDSPVLIIENFQLINEKEALPGEEII